MSTSALTPPWFIGIDVGGTFTDMVLIDACSQIHIVKVPSVPHDPSLGIFNALKSTSEKFQITVSTLLSSSSLFMHGTTVATNTILEHRYSKAGMLTTKGFRDSLEIRRGIRENPWDHRSPYPEVLIPRYLRLPITERIDAQGKILQELSKDDLDRAIETFKQEEVEAVAICFFNAYVNYTHEQEAKAYLQESLPHVFISASSDIVPIIGEYERSSTTAVNASISPRVFHYLKNLNNRLKEEGLENNLWLSQNNGGVVSLTQVQQRLVNLAMSGPAAGVGALKLVAQSFGSDNLISMEIGGTSCDVTLMNRGHISNASHLSISGYHLAVASVDIHTVGTGGGTIAGVDEAGMLFCGPKGAGSNPGPACYELGGEHPTITDAHLFLGRLKPGKYADGAVNLNIELAHQAIKDKIADPLEISVEAAAQGILSLSEQQLVNAVETISTQKGYDPRKFALVACGGAGALHVANVSKKLGCSHYIVPGFAGVYCAMGLLNSDIRQDYLAVCKESLLNCNQVHIEEQFKSLKEQAIQSLKQEGLQQEQYHLQYALELRYRGQYFDVTVFVESPCFSPKIVKSNFEELYQRQFGHIQPDGIIEINALKLIGIGILPKVNFETLPKTTKKPTPYETRKVYLNSDDGWIQTPIYNAQDIEAGQTIVGPAIIEESTTTIVVNQGDMLTVDVQKNYIIQLKA